MKYETHDNGGRAFRVSIDDQSKTAVIDRISFNLDTEKKTYEKLFDISYIHVFVGKSPLNSMTEFSGGHGKKFDGNSILFELAPKRYLFVGERVFEFHTKHTIVDYVSPVGNNDVPYPFAIDDVGNRYLMLEEVFFRTNSQEPYTTYYDHPEREKRKLRLWTQSDKPILMQYAPTVQHYLAANALRQGKPLYMESEGGQKVQVSEAQILKALAKLGKEMGFYRLLRFKEWAARE